MATGAGVTAFTYNRRSLGLTYERVLRYEFAVLEEHRSQMDMSLRRALKDTDARWIAVRDKVRETGEVEQWAEEYHEQAELLPRLQWNAQFILAYATFEHCLNRLCLMAKSRAGSAVDLRSYGSGKHKGIIKAQKYLDEVGGITSPFQTPEWTAVVNLNTLRNVIAHSSGEFSDPPSKEQEKALKLATKFAGLSVLSNPDKSPDRFKLTSGFVHSAIHSLWALLELVCRAEPSAGKLIHGEE